MLVNISMSRQILQKFRVTCQNRKMSSVGSQLVKSFSPGSKYSGFTVKEVKQIVDLDMHAVRLSHDKTGALYYHFAKDDANNVFSIGFRTPAINNYGTTHILEHNVLCGSKKFPCNDPFMKMLNRSLSTFMNAMTGPDYTFYPFATQNKQDFRNLMSVYLDAVLNPNLKEESFRQEGWRLEQEHPKDDASQIIFKGVVFNEMKGFFADSQQSFSREIFNATLPSHAYGYESGGVPIEIPSLSWEDLKSYHHKHYHPSNSYIVTYGDQPLEDHLAYLDENFLSKFNSSESSPIVPSEANWTSPREIHVSCNPDPVLEEDKQNSVAVSYMLSDLSNIYENFVLSILNDLLISGSSSPFYKSLLESKLGSSYCSASGLDTHTRNTTFTIGLQGVKSSDMQCVKETIENTFREVFQEGFPEKRIESIIHDIELGLKHQTSNFGLNLTMSAIPLINNKVDPIEALQITESVSRLREDLKDPKYLQNLVKRYFLDNTHKLISTMSPDSNLQDKLKKEENELLQSRVAKLTDSDIAKIKVDGIKMQENLDKDEDLSCLPTLYVSDIPREFAKVPYNKVIHNGNPVYIHNQPTNGVAYFRAVLGIKDIPENLKPYISLLCNLLTSMGAGKYDFKDLEEEAKLVCSGLSCSLHISRDPHNINSYEHGLVISSYSLMRNFSSMMDLWECVLNELKLDDEERLTTLLNIITTSFSNSLTHNGHTYAMLASASSTNYISKIKNEASGLPALESLQKLNQLPDKKEVLSKLLELSKLVLNKSNMRVSINAPPNHSQECYEKVTKFLDNLEGSFVNERIVKICESSDCETSKVHEVFPFPVNYAAKSLPCVSYSHPDSAPLRVLARLMFKFLHREIREKGGAYGGGASYSPGEPFQFYSYRDPRSLQTFDSFSGAVEWVLNKQFTEQDLNEAKLGVFQKLDSPVSAGSKGMREFLYNISHDTFCNHRLAVLDASYDSIIEVTQKYLKGTKEGMCLIGPKNEDIAKDNSWKIVEH